MGKSLRSKRMNRNRNIKRVRNAPRVVEKLKEAIAFEYNDQNSNAHLSMFHELMNGPPPAVPGLEAGSKLAKAHLTAGHFEQEVIAEHKQKRTDLRLATAARALDRTAKSYDTHPREQTKRKKDTVDEVEKMDDKVPRVFNHKTLRDQFGQYPDWMSSKNIARRSRANRLKKRKEQKRLLHKTGKKGASKSADVEMKDCAME